MYYSPTLTSPSNRSRFPRQVTARAATKRAKKGALISSLRWRRASMPKCHVEVGGEGEDLAAAVVVPVHYTGPAENREEGENELGLHNRASESSATSESEEPKYD